MMGRREFITLMAGAAVMGPAALYSQQGGRSYRIVALLSETVVIANITPKL